MRKIDFASNNITEEGFTALFESFKENPNLRYVNLNDNSIKNSAVKLCEALPLLSKLEVLQVSDNFISEKNSLSIFEALKDLEKLHTLEFAYNEIEEKDTQMKIFNLLLTEGKFKSLNKMVLFGNEIDEELNESYNYRLMQKFKEIELYEEEEIEARDLPPMEDN